MSEADIRLRLSAQAALLGAVTPNLRSFSVELREGVIHTLAVFETEPSEYERELINVATAEILADFTVETLDDQIVFSRRSPAPRLDFDIYRRHET